MKKKIILTIIAATAAALLWGTLFADTAPKRERYLSRLIHSGLAHWHYSGKKLDDEFSRKAFQEFLEVLDPNKRFLLQKDVDYLRKFRDKVDDQFADGSTDLMTVATARIRQRVNQVKAFHEPMLEKPFDFSTNETLELDADKRTYRRNMTELKAYWQKILKFRVLFRYIDELKREKKEAPDAALEEKARKSVAKTMKNFFNRLLQTYENDALSLYINSLVRVYDPHTTYFQPVDKQTFDMHMTGSFEGIGALLGQEDSYVKVASIIPGGPSWKQKQLQAEDLILKVGQGDKEPEDIVGMRVTDAVKLIRGKKGTVVKLTVKKPDGNIVVIPIMRDVVVLEETFARSAVVTNGKDGQRFGYIYLPKFYTDYANKNGRNSTDDVRKELEKLKAQNVEGVILDLRNNGGGALRDAVRMSGLFITEGPVVQVKSQKAGIEVLEDPDNDVVYKGPLVVMVSTLSASASEILAAALQDYGRAVIVGSGHSFGKGTVQVMVNLDRYASREVVKDKSLGALTITVQKFYRINGTAIQHKGVIPDVVLPDRHAALDIGEQHLDYSLNWDTIPTTDYDKWDLQPVNKQKLAENSQRRVKENPAFQALVDYVETVKLRRDDTLQSLSIKDVRARQAKLKKERDAFTKSQKVPLGIEVIPSAEMDKKATEQMLEIEKDRRKEWFKDIQKDHQLKEALSVLTDILAMQASPVEVADAR